MSFKSGLDTLVCNQSFNRVHANEQRIIIVVHVVILFYNSYSNTLSNVFSYHDVKKYHSSTRKCQKSSAVGYMCSRHLTLLNINKIGCVTLPFHHGFICMFTWIFQAHTTMKYTRTLYVYNTF